MCAGAFLWGILIDVIGRKWAFNISLFVTSFFGLLVSVRQSSRHNAYSTEYFHFTHSSVSVTTSRISIPASELGLNVSIAGVPSNFGAICALAALCGLGLGGNIPIDATILLEFLPAVSTDSTASHLVGVLTTLDCRGTDGF